jgi:hypothetical protein
LKRNRRITAIQGKSNRFIDRWETSPTADSTDEPTSSAQGFTCEGKALCREMVSCEEAQFYLTTCGVTRIDGNNDGIPCSSLCR